MRTFFPKLTKLFTSAAAPLVMSVDPNCPQPNVVSANMVLILATKVPTKVDYGGIAALLRRPRLSWPLGTLSTLNCTLCGGREHSRGKILHTRTHNNEIPCENATEHPLDNSSKQILWTSDNPFWTYQWNMNLCWNMPLKVHRGKPLKIQDDFLGVDLWFAICCL